MKFHIVKDYGSRIFTLAVAPFVALLAFFIFLLFYLKAPSIKYLVLLLAIINVAFFLLMFFKQKKKRKILSFVSEIFDAESSSLERIKFRRKTRYKLGYLDIVGEWEYYGRVVTYNISSNFNSMQEGFGDDVKINPEFLKKNTIFVRKDLTSYMHLPSLEFEIEGSKAYLLLIPKVCYLPNKEVSLEIYDEKGNARFFGKIEEGKIEGTLETLPKRKCRGARVELCCVGKNRKFSLTLAEASRGSINVVKQLNLDDDFIVLSLSKNIHPSKLLEKLSVKKPVLIGFGEGECYLNLILNIAFGKDIVRSIKIK